MVNQGIVLGHIVSKRGIKVAKFKVELIDNLSTLKCVMDVKSFLGHASFYRHFIKDFSALSQPLYNLLAKDDPFEWAPGCEVAFKKLKNMLIMPPIMQPPSWELPFKLMCDASDYEVGAMLGQWQDKKHHVI